MNPDKVLEGKTYYHSYSENVFKVMVICKGENKNSFIGKDISFLGGSLKLYNYSNLIAEVK